MHNCTQCQKDPRQSKYKHALILYKIYFDKEMDWRDLNYNLNFNIRNDDWQLTKADAKLVEILGGGGNLSQMGPFGEELF